MASFVRLNCIELALVSSMTFVRMVDDFQVKDMHIAKRDEDIGFYAGYIGKALGFDWSNWGC